MRKKMFWGVVTLIILLVGVISFVMLTRTTEPGIIVNDVPEETLDNIRKENNRQILSTQKPPDEPGFVWEWHGDHWHKMPIAETEVSTPNTKSVETVPTTKSGGLTYHAELLETNPVKALRLQAEERGHWSKDHIPPFPPDDTEAQAFARNRYLIHYYESIGDESNPIYGNAARAYLSQMDVFSEYPSGARKCDLLRIMWTNLDAGYIRPYGGMTRYGRARMFPSDYFPDFIDVPK